MSTFVFLVGSYLLIKIYLRQVFLICQKLENWNFSFCRIKTPSSVLNAEQMIINHSHTISLKNLVLGCTFVSFLFAIHYCLHHGIKNYFMASYAPPLGNCATVLVITILILTYATGQQAFIKYVQRQVSAFVFNKNISFCSITWRKISKTNAVAPIS